MATPFIREQLWYNIRRIDYLGSLSNICSLSVVIDHLLLTFRTGVSGKSSNCCQNYMYM
jgi:hypothetical protein